MTVVDKVVLEAGVTWIDRNRGIHVGLQLMETFFRGDI